MANRGPERQYLQSRGLGPQNGGKHKSRYLINPEAEGKRKERLVQLGSILTLGLGYCLQDVSYTAL